MARDERSRWVRHVDRHGPEHAPVSRSPRGRHEAPRRPHGASLESRGNLLVNGRRIDLSTNRFPGTTHPEGFRFLTGFRMDPFPTFTWDAGRLVVEKEVFMPHGENTVCVTWR